MIVPVILLCTRLSQLGTPPPDATSKAAAVDASPSTLSSPSSRIYSSTAIDTYCYRPHSTLWADYGLGLQVLRTLIDNPRQPLRTPDRFQQTSFCSRFQHYTRRSESLARLLETVDVAKIISDYVGQNLRNIIRLFDELIVLVEILTAGALCGPVGKAQEMKLVT